MSIIDRLLGSARRRIDGLAVGYPNGDSGPRAQAISRVVAIGTHAVKPLIEALRMHPDEHIRSGAAEALGDIGDRRAGGPLISALRDQEWVVRRHAALSLGKLGAGGALTKLDSADAVERLVQTLRDPDSYVRSAAAEALGSIGDPCAEEPLLGLLHDEYAVARLHVVIALGNLGSAISVDPLTQARNHDDWSQVREKAAEALAKIESRNSKLE